MRDDPVVPRRHSPPTPRSAKLGKELRKLREEKGLTAEQLGQGMEPVRSQSWVSRAEKGLIKLRPGDVTEILVALGIRPHAEGKHLVDMAKTIKEDGWWQRLDALSLPLLQFIGFEAEAQTILVFEPLTFPGLFQTADYARALCRVGRETEPAKVEQKVTSRLNRQKILTREDPPFVHVVISEAALLCEVGGEDVLRGQIQHVVDLASRPNITVQVLRFQAGAHLADRGAFNILGFGEGDPDLGFVDTVTGALFLEAPNDVDWLINVWRDVTMRGMSPAETGHYLDGIVRWKKS